MSPDNSCGFKCKEGLRNVFAGVIIEYVRGHPKLSTPPFQSFGALLRYNEKVVGMGDVLTVRHGIPVTREDMIALKNGGWINDRIINLYFEILQEHFNGIQSKAAYVFSTFFYQLLTGKESAMRINKWIGEVGILTYDTLLIPIHLRNHWTLAVHHVKSGELQYYDSLGNGGAEVVARIRSFLKEQNTRREISLRNPGHTLQNNGCDCGVFVCMYAKRILEGQSCALQSHYVRTARQSMLHEIFIGRIIYSSEHRFTT